jgi:ATP-binding cassette, subfamily F, member 3
LSLLSIESICKSYFNMPILTDVGFKVHMGDRIGLIGKNGAGKTTLFRIITGEEEADSGRVVLSGNAIVGYLSQDLKDLSHAGQDALFSKELSDLEADLRDTEKKISLWSKTPDSPEYRELYRRYTMLDAKFEALDGYAYERQMREILCGLGLSEDICSLPFSSLSGGEKMRVALARLLLRKPDLLLLDEPTNHLDIPAVEWLEGELQKYRCGMIVISHDRFFLDRITTATASLEDGQLVFRGGNYSSFIRQKRVEIDFSQKEQKRLLHEIERQSRIKQTMLSHRNISGYHQREKMISKLSNALSETKVRTRSSHQSGLKLSFIKGNAQRNSKKILLQASGLSKRYGNRLLFSDVSFELIAGAKIFLTGPNGCGKSTLLSLFLGDIDDFEGSVKMASGLIFMHMGQHVEFDQEDHTILDELMGCFGVSSGQATEILADYGFFGTDLQKKIHILSGGERSRLYLACALRKEPDLLLLDEPTNHLDIPSREIFEHALKSFKGAFIAISHDRYFIEQCAKKIWGFREGTIQEFDSYDTYRTDTKKQVLPKPRTNTCERPLNKDRTERKNRAEERRILAKNKAESRIIEEKINKLEQEKRILEQSFSSDTHYEEYSHYSKLLEELEVLYRTYVE